MLSYFHRFSVFVYRGENVRKTYVWTCIFFKQRKKNRLFFFEKYCRIRVDGASERRPKTEATLLSFVIIRSFSNVDGDGSENVKKVK